MFQFPAGEALFFGENTVVARMAKAAGIFQSLVGNRVRTYSASGKIVTEHPTHWLLFGHVTGLRNPLDNGLFLIALPNCRFSQAEAEARLRAMIEDTEPED